MQTAPSTDSERKQLFLTYEQSFRRPDEYKPPTNIPQWLNKFTDKRRDEYKDLVRQADNLKSQLEKDMAAWNEGKIPEPLKTSIKIN